MKPDEGGSKDGEGGVKKRAGKSPRQCRSSPGWIEAGRCDGQGAAMKVGRFFF
jgi:hypothetical protein